MWFLSPVVVATVIVSIMCGVYGLSMLQNASPWDTYKDNAETNNLYINTAVATLVLNSLTVICLIIFVALFCELSKLTAKMKLLQ